MQIDRQTHTLVAIFRTPCGGKLIDLPDKNKRRKGVTRKKGERGGGKCAVKISINLFFGLCSGGQQLAPLKGLGRDVG